MGGGGFRRLMANAIVNLDILIFPLAPLNENIFKKESSFLNECWLLSDVWESIKFIQQISFEEKASIQQIGEESPFQILFRDIPRLRSKHKLSSLRKAILL